MQFALIQVVNARNHLDSILLPRLALKMLVRLSVSSLLLLLNLFFPVLGGQCERDENCEQSTDSNRISCVSGRCKCKSQFLEKEGQCTSKLLILV